MSGHTPGPWGYFALLSSSENHKGYCIKGGRFVLADVIPVDADGTEGGANARLIAAAPELLAAAREFQAATFAPNHGEEITAEEAAEFATAWHALTAAIAKATGDAA